MLYLVRFLMGLLYFAGLVIAQGFWSTLFALILPPYSLYLVVERVLVYSQIVPL